MQDELGSHRLVVTDSVFHVASVAVLGHLEPVALLSGGASASTWNLDLPQDTVCPGWLPLFGTAVGSGWRHSPQPCLPSLFPGVLVLKTSAHSPPPHPRAELTWYRIC